MTEYTRLEVGDTAPDFTLLNQDGESVSLHDYRGSKVVVYFYPAAMTPGCTTQACDFRDSFASLTAAGYVVLGISKDAPAKLKKFQERDALPFELLSDEDLAVEKAFGAYGEKNSYGKIITGTLRSTVVLDENGVVTLPWYNVRATGHVRGLRKRLGLDAE